MRRMPLNCDLQDSHWHASYFLSRKDIFLMDANTVKSVQVERGFILKHKLVKTAIMSVAIFAIDVWYNKNVYGPLLDEKYTQSLSE